MITEFRPALFFLGKFLLVYFVGNLIYGFFIESYEGIPDPITKFVTNHSTVVLDAIGYDSDMENHPHEPKVMLKNDGLVVVNVFEGCNGINVMIVFIAFLIAFGGPPRTMIFFGIGGVLLIHLFNLGRISYLFFLALSNSKSFYYYHKYFFTATLYGVVFLLWAVWVLKFAKNQDRAASS
jgi:exosortase family protein XrtF